ncbi:response regulator [Marinovum sp.]|uniref:response regulator n=1 Tax=Marinovum sp. TaxID=2024839 RepID=UPI002B2774D2|nr:response regulator [Marinovum sp.]
MTGDRTAGSGRGKPAVLIVDDEFLLAYDLTEEVEAAGYGVVGPAHSVASALDLIEAERTDCAILDVNLGKETSYPIAEELAARGIPFTFITGYEIRQLDASFREAPLLCKPVQTHALHAKLQEMLSGT